MGEERKKERLGKSLGIRLCLFAALILLCNSFTHASVLEGSASAVSGFSSSNLSDSYDELVDAWYKSGNVTKTITFLGTNYLSIPWYSADNVCGVSNLQSGGNCDIGTVNHTQYCMVSDELTKAGLAISMHDNSTRMAEYYNTLVATNSSSGYLPSWRVVVNHTDQSFDNCRSGVNGNCDTATDADARALISLYVASNNPTFPSAHRTSYRTLADLMADDMIYYEYDNTCRNTTVAGEVCYWMKAGTQATLTGTDGAYSGYFADAAIALLAACVATSNETYCEAAGDTWLNYYAASYPDGESIGVDGFRVPPGKAFKWNFTANASPICTNTCSPDQWDSVDAPRANSLGLLLYYANITEKTSYFTDLYSYVETWRVAKALTDANSYDLQYYPNGTDSSTAQSGYKAQGWQGQLVISEDRATWTDSVVRNAIDHYDQVPETWDYAACAGIYGQGEAIRTLGAAIGKDEAFWYSQSPPVSPSTNYLCDIDETATEASACGVGTGSYVFKPFYMYVNYTVPFGGEVATSLWQVQHGKNAGAYNITLTNCSDDDGVLQLRILSNMSSTYSGGGFTYSDRTSEPQCYNGTSWEAVGTRYYSENLTLGSSGTTGRQSLTYDENYSTQAYYADYTPHGGTTQGWMETLGSNNASIYEEGVYWNITSGVTFKFYDETTGTLMSGTSITAYVTGTSESHSFTTTTGTYTINNITGGDYTVTFSGTGYAQRQQVIELDNSSSEETYDLYLLPEDTYSNVQATVYDNLGDSVTGAIVYAQKKNLSGTNYYTVETCETGGLGRCLLRLELYDTTYRFLVYYGGVLEKTTNDQRLSSTSIQFVIRLITPAADELLDDYEVAGDVTYDNTTDDFTMTWADPEGVVTSACLKITKKLRGTTTTMNSSCSSGSSGTITLFTNTSDFGTYDAQAYVVTGDGQFIIGTYSVANQEFASGLGDYGLFLFGFLLLGVIAFAALWSPAGAVISLVVGEILLYSLGLLNVGTAALYGLVALGVIVVVRLKR